MTTDRSNQQLLTALGMNRPTTSAVDEHNARQMLNNLRSARDRGEGLRPLTIRLLRASADSSTHPAAALRDVRRTVDAHYQEDPVSYAERIDVAHANGRLTLTEATTLLEGRSDSACRLALRSVTNRANMMALQENLQAWAGRFSQEPEDETEPESTVSVSPVKTFNVLTEAEKPRKIIRPKK
jgi:hypothetical protein